MLCIYQLIPLGNGSFASFSILSVEVEGWKYLQVEILSSKKIEKVTNLQKEQKEDINNIILYTYP